MMETRKEARVVRNTVLCWKRDTLELKLVLFLEFSGSFSLFDSDNDLKKLHRWSHTRKYDKRDESYQNCCS